jgi:hypothetical protein
MDRIGHLVLLLLLTTVIGVLESARASDFGITRRGFSNSSQSRDYTLPSATSHTSLPLFSSSQSEQPFPNIARLVAFDKKGQSFGSCSYIGSAGNYGIIISNWHVICETDGLTHVYFPSGFSSFGAVIQFDRKWDLAVIVISKPPTSIPPLPIMQAAPRPGEPLWIAGYGSGLYRIASGYCVEYLAPEIPRNGTAPSYEIIKLSTTARQGDSGGPILNKNGELAGVLFGSDMVTSTAGSHCGRVKWFLKQVNPIIANLPQKPEALFASIEPTGPRHLLNGVQQNTIIQVKNPPTIELGVPQEKAAMNQKNNKYNNPNLNQETNNTTNNTINEKEKLSRNNTYDKSTKTNPTNQIKNTQIEYIENRPRIAQEQTNETNNSIEWAYNYKTSENKINTVTKNQVVPSANFQTTDETSEPKVTMAILHFTNEQKNIETTNHNNDIIQNNNLNEIASATDIELGKRYLSPESRQFDRSRKYIAGISVVVLSVLFYLSLCFLKSPDNKKQLAESTTEPEIISINTNPNQDKITEPDKKQPDYNSQKHYKKQRKKAA